VILILEPRHQALLRFQRRRFTAGKFEASM